jgi:hypothetical protein
MGIPGAQNSSLREGSAVFTVKEDGGKLIGNVMVEDIVAPISDVAADGNN